MVSPLKKSGIVTSDQVGPCQAHLILSLKTHDVIAKVSDVCKQFHGDLAVAPVFFHAVSRVFVAKNNRS